MSNKTTYIPSIPDDLVLALRNPLAAMLAVKLPAFEDKEKGTINVTFEYFAELWGLDKRTIKAAADKLQLLQIWHYQTSTGRGNITEWKKGTNYVSFIEQKKVQILQKKGTKNVPYNKDNNKDRYKRVHARANKQTKRKGNAGETPAQPREVMEQFEQFWQAFFFGSYAQYEQTQESYRQRAANVWAHMTESARAACLRDIRIGRRYDRTEYILYYLQKYKEPLPIYVNGDRELTPQFVEQACVLRYKGNIAYCAPEHLGRCKAAGATLIRDNNKK